MALTLTLPGADGRLAPYTLRGEAPVHPANAKRQRAGRDGPPSGVTCCVLPQAGFRLRPRQVYDGSTNTNREPAGVTT